MNKQTNSKSYNKICVDEVSVEYCFCLHQLIRDVREVLPLSSTGEGRLNWRRAWQQWRHSTWKTNNYTRYL